MRNIIHFLVAVCLCVNVASGADLKQIEREISDSVITTKITTKFAKDKHLNPLKIFVSTENGTVTLRGHVNDKEAFISALRITKAVKGVRRVEADDLEIKPVNTSFTDAYITTKVEAAVLKAKILDDESIPLVGINATTNNGIVTLSGTLKNTASIPFLLKRALAVKGVKQVISKLEVSAAAP